MSTRLTALAIAALTLAVAAPSASAADRQLLFVHGYGDADTGKDCNGNTFKNALRYYQDAAGRSRESMTTIGYYRGDDCDVAIGAHGNDAPIQDIARDLARYIAGTGKPVDVIAHSMGGLIARVALLGSAEGWEGFPAKLDVANVVTLSTPHQGLAKGSDKDEQTRQMSAGSGFLKRLHESRLSGADWTLIGSHEDGTVKHDSAIDNGEHADQKLGYGANGQDAGEVDHTGIRELHGSSRYDLTYWHAAGGHPAHHTLKGWSPLKAAYQAATKVGDGLPK